MTDNFPYSEELNIAESAAKEAGAAIMGLFKGKFDVHEKSINNPVTTADLEANRLIRETIHKNFPQDGWLSEEDKDSAAVRGFHRFCRRRPTESRCGFQSREKSVL